MNTTNGLCECGCGKPAPIAKMNQTKNGNVKGQPQRFINGHCTANHWRGGVLKHGMTGTPEHDAYISARYRCMNPCSDAWEDYGGRGIKFLFASFEQFFAELGPRPAGVDARGKALYSLDRIDNDGNYEPGNVRWATREEQRANQGRKYAA
jgi:hypothetical protein